jgi:hypothetical protein
VKDPKVYHPKETQAKLVEIIKAHLPTIPGVDVENDYFKKALDDYGSFDEARNYLNIEFERAWAVGCYLGIATHWGRVEDLKDGRRLQRFKIEVTLNWAATGRDVAGAMAAVALYDQVVKLGALIQTVADERPLGIITDPKK